MTLQELLNQLKYVELSGTLLATEPDDLNTKNKIIYIINNALIEFYSKYRLKESSLLIQTTTCKSSYTISKEFAKTSNSNVVDKYIIDSEANPFLDDYLYPIRAFYLDQEIAINCEDRWSIFVSAPNVLTIPTLLSLQNPMYEILYVAKQADVINDDDNINMPTVLLTAFKTYIAYLYYDTLTGQDTSNKVQFLLTKYQQEIDNLKIQGLLTLNNDIGFSTIDKGLL